MGKSHFHRLVVPLMLAAGAIQWLVAYATQLNTRAAITTTQQVARSNARLRALALLQTHVAEAESERRGQLLSADPAHWESFQARIREARQDLTQLRAGKSLADSAALEALDRAVEAKLAHLESPDTAAARGSSMEASRDLMNAVRDRIGEMQNAEKQFLEAKVLAATAEGNKAIQTIYLGNFVSFSLVTTALVLLEREGKRRMQVADQLRRQEEQYRSLVVNIPDVPWQTDASGSPKYLGDGFEKITGYTAEEVVEGGSAFWRTRVHDDDIEAVNLGFQRLFGENQPLEVEFRFQRKDGGWVWLYSRASSVFEDKGMRYTQGLVSDISSRKAAEENNARLTRALAESNKQLEARTREAERATRLKSRFLANMSHELRTPLNAIIGFSELLSDASHGPATEKQKRWIGHIRAGSTHLLQLINDILDLSKIEADQLEFRPEVVRLAEAVPEVMSIVRPLARARQVHLAEQVLDDIALRVDRTRLKQIIYNLLSNAVKFTPPHGLVRIEARELAEDVCISVRDTGIGIRKEDQEVIFEEFRQASPTSKGVPEGTGLGLAITRRLVERQGGRIWLESEVGKGSRFSFTVKRAHLPPPALALRPAGRPAHRRTRILVIEDDAVARELFLSYLQSEGYQTWSTASVDEGWQMALACAPDAIVLDLLLRNAEGWELLQRCKGEPALADVPVIVVSIVDRREKGIALGAADYLLKPVSRHALLQSLRKHVRPEGPNLAPSETESASNSGRSRMET